MKTIKVIDLLNNIVNDKKVPKIKDKEFRSISYYLYDKCGAMCDDSELKNMLNYEFEIIEEKKIPEKLNLDTDELRGKETPRAIDYLIESKINQVIDYLENKKKENENE